MLSPNLFSNANQQKHLLCLGAHCDDIEIGCGGTLLHILDLHPDVHVTWVIFTSTEERKLEAVTAANKFTSRAKSRDIKIFGLRDGFLPYHGEEVKELFESVKRDLICPPDLIFTHFRHDLHQDHRKVNELTWNTFRNQLILEYEIPKWDGDLGIPNTFVPLKEDICKLKIQTLQDVYNTQRSKNWFTDDIFWSLLRIRGMECNSPSRFAEAFHVRKLSLIP